MSSKPCVFILYNLRSGKASLQERDQLYRIAHDEIDTSRFQLCFKDALELDRNFHDTLELALDIQPEYFAVVGGDGTIQTTATQLIKLYSQELPGESLPNMLVLPSGTMNNLSTSLGMFSVTSFNLLSLMPNRRFRTKSVNTFRRFVKALNDDCLETVRVPVIKVVCDGNEEDRQYGFIFATGPVNRIINDYYARKGDLRGRSTAGTVRAITAGLLTISQLAVYAFLFNGGDRYVPMKGHMVTEDETFFNPLAVAVSTIPKLGLLALSPFYLVRGEKGLCRAGTTGHVIILTMEPRKLGAITLYKGLTGRIRDRSDAVMIETSRLLFQTEEPLPFLLDAQTEYPLPSEAGIVQMAPMRALETMEVTVGEIQVPLIQGFGKH